MSTIISGKEIAANRRENLKVKVDELKAKGLTPNLNVILVGDNNPSQVYVRNKKKIAEEIGIDVNVINLSDTIPQHELVSIINSLNNDHIVHGIILQLPIAEHLEKFELLQLISPHKDVDGITPYNSGKLLQGQRPFFIPATAKGVYNMLKDSNIDVKSKNVVIVGRSIIVGRPLAALLLNHDATVTITHSKTENLSVITSQADILIVATGNPKFIKATDIKENAIVIDVGINNIEGKLVGDVDFEDVKNKASYISQVPGGVGPMTIVSLLENAYEAAILSAT